MHATIIGKRLDDSGPRDGGALCGPVPMYTITHWISLLGGRKGSAILSSSPPDSSLAPRFLPGGAPRRVPMLRRSGMS